MENGKLRGIPSEWVEKLAALPGVTTLLVEADGAAGRPLKAPREDEPVLPQETSLLIPVVGIDALGSPLEEKHVFRSELGARLLHLQPGQEVTPEIVADFLALTVRKRPAAARVIPFVNKMDLPGALAKGRILARRILAREGIGALRVVLGNAKGSPPVREIIDPGDP